MALDHLLAALERDATVAAERLLAEGRAEAGRLTAASTATADQRRDAEVTRVRQERRARMEEELGVARRAARGELLGARERLLGRIDAELRRALPAAVGRPEYQGSLPQRVMAGLACLAEDEQVTVRAPAALIPAIRKAWPRGRVSAITPDEAAGSGFRLASADGAVEIEETLEARYTSLRGVLMREALQQLGEAP